MTGARGVVTLCDERYFAGLLMLYRSVQESMPCEVAAYDIGLTHAQREVAARLPRLLVLPLPDDPDVACIQATLATAPALAKAIKRVWPLWVCPLMIRHAPFRDVVWMDCDLVVLRQLDVLFDMLDEGPVFTPENKAPHLTANNAQLYSLLPIARSFDHAYPAVNAGVSGWRKDRDAEVLDAYVHAVMCAVADLAVRAAMSWHDQGALIWAIQRCALEHRVMPTTRFNLCADHTPMAHTALPWDDTFLAAARALVPDAAIVHWNGCTPPWLAGVAA